MGRRQKKAVSPRAHIAWYFSLLRLSPCRASYFPSTSFSPGVLTLTHCATTAFAAATKRGSQWESPSLVSSLRAFPPFSSLGCFYPFSSLWFLTPFSFSRCFSSFSFFAPFSSLRLLPSLPSPPFPPFQSASQASSWVMRVSTALVSKTLTAQVSRNSWRPMESWRQSWSTFTMAGSTMTFLSTFLASQKASNSPSSFMNQTSSRKVLRPLLSCTISTKPPRRSRPSRSTPSTPLARMCGAHFASVSQLKMSQLSPAASGSASSSAGRQSSSRVKGCCRPQGQGAGCRAAKKGAASCEKMSSCLGKKRKAWRVARKGLAWLSRLPLFSLSVLARCWNTSPHSTIRCGSCSSRNCSAAATTSSTVLSSSSLLCARPRKPSRNSRRLSFVSLSSVFTGGTSSGSCAVQSAFLKAPSSISALSSVILKQAARQAAMMSSFCARLTSTFCLAGFGGTTRVERKKRLTGQLSHRQVAMLLNLIGAIRILLNPTLVNSLTKNSSVKGVPGCLISSNCMNQSYSC